MGLTLAYCPSSLIYPLPILPCSPTRPSYREIQEATPRGRSGHVRWNLRNLGRGLRLGVWCPQGGNSRASHLLSCMDLQGHTLHSQGQLWSVSEPKVPELNLSSTRPERPGCAGGQPPGSLGQGTGWAQVRGAVPTNFSQVVCFPEPQLPDTPFIWKPLQVIRALFPLLF